jgi:hypothetical protein
MEGKTNDVSEEVNSSDNSPRRTRPNDPTDSQKEQSLERLKKIKNDPSRQVDLERLRKEITGSAIPDDKSLNPPPTKRGSLVGAWDAVLNASKVSINDKIDSTRKETNSPFKMTDGTGKVQSIIGEWEKLFVQKTATNEEVTNCVKGAQHRIKQADIIWPNSPAKKNAAEMFEIGSTHVYKLEDLQTLSQGGVDVSPSVLLLEKLLADNSGRPLVLSSGVYGGKEGKPAISTTAIALIAEDGKAYIGLTVNVAKGHGYANDDTAYGIHKISVFLTNDTPGGDHLLSSIQLLQREINVVRKDTAYVSTAFDGYLISDDQEVLTSATDTEIKSPTFESAAESAVSSMTPVSSTVASHPSVPIKVVEAVGAATIIPLAATAAVVGVPAVVAASASSAPRAVPAVSPAPPVVAAASPAPPVVSAPSPAPVQPIPVKIVDAPSPPNIPNLVTPTVSRPLPVSRLATPFPGTPAAPAPAADSVVTVAKPLVPSGTSPVNLTPRRAEVAQPVVVEKEEPVVKTAVEEIKVEEPEVVAAAPDLEVTEPPAEVAPAVVPEVEEPPRLVAVPNQTESWVPRSVKFHNRLYYWDPYRGTYSATPLDIVYNPPLPKPKLVPVQKPSWVTRKPSWAPKNPFKAKKAAPAHKIMLEGQIYEWDERSSAYYPKNFKIDIKTKEQMAEGRAVEESKGQMEEESKGEVEESKGEVVKIADKVKEGSKGGFLKIVEQAKEESKGEVAKISDKVQEESKKEVVKVVEKVKEESKTEVKKKIAAVAN